ncbi:MAG: TylF/MycF family methyltransferase [Oscillospiraceae bacterium]|nr:TylF/MycF family methyltransferase [Oscillospiraceae bacterium]
MKVVLFGAGATCKQYIENITPDIEISAIADNDKNKAGSTLYGHSIISPEKICNIYFEKIVLCVNDWNETAIDEICLQLQSLGIPENSIVLHSTRFTDTSPRVKFLHLIYNKLIDAPGDIAECGVHIGNFASHINRIFKNHTLWLFDTFTGFDRRDLAFESESSMYFNKKVNNFKTASEKISLLKCPNRSSICVRKGYVPDTFSGLEDKKFKFVNLDMDLYAPTIAAMRFFAPRMIENGIILIHDYNNIHYDGVKRAVNEFQSEANFVKIPIVQGGVAVIMK